MEFRDETKAPKPNAEWTILSEFQTAYKEANIKCNQWEYVIADENYDAKDRYFKACHDDLQLKDSLPLSFMKEDFCDPVSNFLKFINPGKRY